MRIRDDKNVRYSLGPSALNPHYTTVHSLLTVVTVVIGYSYTSCHVVTKRSQRYSYKVTEDIFIIAD